MFPSHRPKIFRSRLGCCICKAKSSSSRFTSSAKYEHHFEGCFALTEKRQGEICNACVLLVKRWSKLPPGTEKNWKHVVNSKATVKRNIKPRRASRQNPIEIDDKLDHEDETPITRDSGSPEIDDAQADDEEECLSPTLACVSPSPTPSEISEEYANSNSSSNNNNNNSNNKDVTQVTSTGCQTSFLFPTLSSSTKLPYIDLSLWRREEICCGTIFRGPHGEVLVDPKLLKPLCTCSTSHSYTKNTFPKVVK
ncbi:SIN3-HDAC complex-associated factor [Nematostella vectensis]|uniref:SIN3-HDAC complex-associated factor n=1 Tax=Nematostella vectensis TaxID=45351 RepID=UPI00138FE3FB|nr:SIN3-HDAC complex-associated factor [Nematostella vectensis]